MAMKKLTCKWALLGVVVYLCRKIRKFKSREGRCQWKMRIKDFKADPDSGREFVQPPSDR